MNFFKKLFSPPPSNPGKFYNFAVRCKRCGEIIHGQVNVYNDPSLEFDEKGQPYYICRKVLVGNQLCFQQIEIIFKFNEVRGLLDRQITGGEYVEK
jgi:DNA-directed RNA polymerase subunit N (RpoN/RPB10)